MDTIAFLRHPREMAGLGNTRRKIAALAAVALIVVGCGGDTTASVSTLPRWTLPPSSLNRFTVVITPR